MSGQWWLPDALFRNGDLISNEALCIHEGRIAAIAPAETLGKEDQLRAMDGIVSPGLVDLQVNGGAGVMLNTSPTAEGIAAIVNAHRSVGTAHILPTVITDDPAILRQAVDAALDVWGLDGVAGIHIEGPHLSFDRRGTHKPEFIRPMCHETQAMVEELRAAGIPTMITVAPEMITPEQVKALSQTGAIVSLGHSNATFDDATAALKAGALCFTHLFNGMSQMGNRDPGMVGAALLTDAYAGFICDGHHVSDDMLKLAVDAKRKADRMFLVSDAMSTVAGPDTFKLYDMEITLDDGKLVNPEGSLAGAHTTMTESVRRATEVLDIDVCTALKMSVSTPAKLMGCNNLAELIGQPTNDVLLWTNGLKDWQWLANTDLLNAA